MSDAYDGPECQEKYTVKKDDHYVQMHVPKPNYNIRSHNADNEEVGCMDFNGQGIEFEGIADQSAMAFIAWVDVVFQGRLKDERNKVRKELEELLLQLKQGAGANSEYIQGRWDLIGEFQDVILERIEK